MSVAVHRPAPYAIPTRAYRAARLTRATTLTISGLTVTFTAQWHQQAHFNLQLLTFSLIAFALTSIGEWVTLRKTHRNYTPLLLGSLSLLTALATLTTGTHTIALILAAWALTTGLIECGYSLLRTTGHRDAIFIGALGVLLAVAVTLTQHDTVAVIGFFGSYGVIAGIFLSIAAFDQENNTTPEARPDTRQADTQ